MRQRLGANSAVTNIVQQMCECLRVQITLPNEPLLPLTCQTLSITLARVALTNKHTTSTAHSQRRFVGGPGIAVKTDGLRQTNILVLDTARQMGSYHMNEWVQLGKINVSSI